MVSILTEQEEREQNKKNRQITFHDSNLIKIVIYRFFQPLL